MEQPARQVSGGRAGALRRLAGCGLVGLLGLAACAGPDRAGPPPGQPGGAFAYRTPEEAAALPEGASGLQAKPGWTFRRQAVVAAHPLAADAAHQVLRAGGTAMDAAVAAHWVLGVVEPQSSGPAGGLFLLHWDGHAVQALDGRETAPQAADERLFLQPDGSPLPFAQAVAGGLAVGVPGAVRALAAAHARHGRLPWADLLQPAIMLAEQGFAVGPRLHAALSADTLLREDAGARATFHRPDGSVPPIGSRLRQPALAATLRTLAAAGPEAFYRGPLAEALVQAVRSDPRRAGRMTLDDLARYQPRWREPLCTDWQRWRLCGMPPPSSGHLAVAQILGLLDAAAPPAAGAASDPVEHLHRTLEAARLAFADRAAFVADPDFVAAPGGRWDQLLAPAYLRQRAAGIGARVQDEVKPGQPPGAAAVAWSPSPEQPERGTTHLSVVDAQGRAVALTSSIEATFGARLMVEGLLLNNQLTDFAFLPRGADGRPVANRVEPGKRPRSSMSPTLVFDRTSGRLEMVTGSPGGAMIIHFVVKALHAGLAEGQAPQAAADRPNFGIASANGTPALLEAGRFDAATQAALRARGHAVREMPLPSGLHTLQRTAEGWAAGADPRREGVARGD